MKISRKMDLAQLAARMDANVTQDEVAKMRDLLVLLFGGQDTVDLLDDEWLVLLEQIVPL
ncbi:hypothetical protein [Aeromonas sanarellii]|uniref:hypothetical protein n=1 Tax=Aeromonas sanarellii TaxID=633415 RepID=UPI003B9F6171